MKAVMRLVAIDEDPLHLDLTRAALADQPLEIFTAVDPRQGLDLIRNQHPHIVLVDPAMPSLAGMEILEGIMQIDPGVDIILITSSYSTESAVEAIKKGAYDCLTKPVSEVVLRERIAQLFSNARERQRSLRVEDELLEVFQFEGMIGRSPVMLEVFGKIRRVAPHFRTILLTGETGTGKEVAARALHQLSLRSNAPFVACNCSAIVETLFESEFFGHVKGSFTGATDDKIGTFEYANGGTVMLDEIGDLPLTAQAKFLRLLQNHEIQRVGSPKVRKVDVRIIAATHRDLQGMVAEGKFRKDLYFRLSTMEIRLPSLSERKEDILLLVKHFVRSFAAQYNKQIKGLTRRAQAIFSRYSWPGNVRELENVIHHACMITEKNTIDVNDLPEYLWRGQNLPGPKNETGETVCTLEELQQRYVHEIVDRSTNKAQAARILGISRTTLYHLLGNKPEDKPLKGSPHLVTNRYLRQP